MRREGAEKGGVLFLLSSPRGAPGFCRLMYASFEGYFQRVSKKSLAKAQLTFKAKTNPDNPYPLNYWGEGSPPLIQGVGPPVKGVNLHPLKLNWGGMGCQKLSFSDFLESCDPADVP